MAHIVLEHATKRYRGGKVTAVEDLSIEKILQMEHIGISNACLRLKMKSQNTARFLFESEQGVGSCVTVRIPVEKLKKLERSGKKST